MMKVGAVSLGWSGTSLPKVFEQLSAIRGECIEINGRAQQHHGVNLEAPSGPQQVRAWAEDAEVEIGSVSGYCDFAQTETELLTEEIERLLGSCRAAADMDVPVVRAFIGDAKEGLTLDDVRDNIVAAFREATQEAESLGITLGIENHGHLINDGPALMALVEDVGADNLGFTLDTGNFAWAGHGPEQVRRDFEAVLPRVINVHVKDGKWTNEGFTFVTAGEGELELDWLIEALLERGYDGCIHSEYEGSGNFLECTRRSIAYLKCQIETST